MYEAFEDVYREGLVYFACTGCQSMEEAAGGDTGSWSASKHV